MYQQFVVLNISLTLLLLGCGSSQSDRPKTAPVRGVVTFNKEPLVGAQVTLMAVGASRGAVGTTNQDGEFTLSTFGSADGAIIGEHRVTISCWEAPAFALGKTFVDSSEYEKAKRMAETAGQSTEPVSRIPKRYSQIDSSELIANVEAGKKNYFTFDLIE
jgi:hypothetical protein